MKAVSDVAIDDCDCDAWREVIDGDVFIWINISEIMDRKNMNKVRLAKKIDRVWLQEFVCGLLEIQGKWNRNLCKLPVCPVYTTIQRMMTIK